MLNSPQFHPDWKAPFMTSINLTSIRTASLLLVTALLAGCRPGAPGTPIVSPSSRPVSMITPIEFYSPDQKRLSQHLGWQTGCFKVDYSGPPANILERLEVWRDGKPVGNSGSSSGRAENAELSISVRDAGTTPGTYLVTQVLSAGMGSSSTSGTHKRPELGSHITRVARLQSPVELQSGQEVAVWALILRKSNPQSSHTDLTSGSVGEQAASSDWALVLKVQLQPTK